MKNETARVAWVSEPHRYGGYSMIGIEKDGGHFVSGEISEMQAKAICSQLTIETKGAAGGYIVVYV